MKAPKYNAEEYRVLCIILVVIIAVMGWMWYQSEENRLKLLDELNETKSHVEELNDELYKYRGY